MKILFSCPDKNLQGGPPTHLYLLEEELKIKINVTSFNFGRKKDVEKIHEKFFGRLSDLFKLIKKIRKFKPDIIHHNSAFDNFAIIRDAPLVFVSRIFSIPLFIKFHGSHYEAFQKQNIFIEALKNCILKKSDAIGVLSESEKNEFTDKWNFLDGKVFSVKNIIKDEFFNCIRAENEFPLILFVSRFIKKKGAFELLKAAEVIVKKRPDVNFVFIGSGEDADEFDREVLKYNLTDNVKRIDHLKNSETIIYYLKAWCLVFPTHFPEGMPMVIAEAMASGLPVITSKTRFSISYMNEYEHCLYIDPLSLDSILEKIQLMINDKSLRDNISSNNKKLSLDFKAEIVSDEYIKIYKNIFQKN